MSLAAGLASSRCSSCWPHDGRLSGCFANGRSRGRWIAGVATIPGASCAKSTPSCVRWSSSSAHPLGLLARSHAQRGQSRPGLSARSRRAHAGLAARSPGDGADLSARLYAVRLSAQSPQDPAHDRPNARGHGSPFPSSSCPQAAPAALQRSQANLGVRQGVGSTRGARPHDFPLSIREHLSLLLLVPPACIPVHHLPGAPLHACFPLGDTPRLVRGILGNDETSRPTAGDRLATLHTSSLSFLPASASFFPKSTTILNFMPMGITPETPQPRKQIFHEFGAGMRFLATSNVLRTLLL